VKLYLFHILGGNKIILSTIMYKENENSFENYIKINTNKYKTTNMTLDINII